MIYLRCMNLVSVIPTRCASRRSERTTLGKTIDVRLVCEPRDSCDSQNDASISRVPKRIVHDMNHASDHGWLEPSEASRNLEGVLSISPVCCCFLSRSVTRVFLGNSVSSLVQFVYDAISKPFVRRVLLLYRPFAVPSFVTCRSSISASSTVELFSICASNIS